MMPDILVVTPTALAAAEQREQELYQKRLAQQQAALEAARTLEQVVETMADDEYEYDEEAEMYEEEHYYERPSESYNEYSSQPDESYYQDEIYPAVDETQEDAKMDTLDEQPEISDEIIPEFASLITPVLNEQEAEKTETAEKYSSPEGIKPAEVGTETVIHGAQTPDEIYRSVTQQMEEEEPKVKPTPAPAVRKAPMKPSSFFESEEAPAFRPGFNIDIDV